MILKISSRWHEEEILLCPGHIVTMTNGKTVISRNHTYKIPERKPKKAEPCGLPECKYPCCKTCGAHDVYRRGHKTGCSVLAQLASEES